MPAVTRFACWRARSQPNRPDRARADEDLLAALNGVTNWRMERSALVLTGSRTLRSRADELTTNSAVVLPCGTEPVSSVRGRNPGSGLRPAPE